jgi:G8 domain
VKLPDLPAPVIRPRTKCPHRTSLSLRDWHVPSTWNRRRIPRQGENVIFPINTKVVVRRSVREILGIVTIPSSSELIFAENSTHGITFDTRGIDVQGALTMGSETCRLEASVTITLHGEHPEDVVTNVPDPVVKGISVTGRINIHGRRFYRTWTRLSRTVNVGDTILMLQHRVHWNAGQQIILVTTAMKDSREWHQNEIAVVKNIVTNPVAGVATAVFLKDPVQYRHLATANYQGEVGLFSRMITIQGSDISEPDDKDTLNFRTIILWR